MKFDETRETYGKIAALYYMGGQSQDEITEIVALSIIESLDNCKDR